MNAGIRFLRRRNLGNFEHLELEITDVIQEGSNATKVTKELMGFVKDALYDTGEFAHQVTSKAPVAAATAPASKTAIVKEAKVPETKVEEKATETQAELPLETKAEENKVAEKKVETKVAEVKAPKKNVETKVVTKASKATAYDRLLDAHKNNLGVFLDSKFPSWRKPENLKKAGVASRELQGTEFLDGEGNVLESFKEAFSKYMVDLIA